mgnify:CR=1 FL=1
MTSKRPSFTDEEALAFHRYPQPGKLSITPTKPMATQKDLSLAYSPGVAIPVLAIAKNPELAYDYTSKGNMVAVISNGTVSRIFCTSAESNLRPISLLTA